MRVLVWVVVLGIGFRLWPEAPTEAALLVGLALVLAAGELPSIRRGRLKR